MTQQNSSAEQRPVGGDPAPEVPEADAAEQRLPAADDGTDNGWEDPSEESFERASEADVVEQAIEAGDDEEDEWR